MIRTNKFGVSLLIALALGGTISVFAEPSITEAQRKLLARRAAEADCYRKLAESVYGVQINSETYVRDFVAESDEIRSAVDAFIIGVRLSAPRYNEDGTCEVDAEFPVTEFVSKLEDVRTTHYHGRSVTMVDIERLEQTTETDVIRVTGTGAPREELPPQLPIGTEAAITPLPIEFAVASSIPAIWKSAGGQARLLAVRAAEIDATRKLLERIKGLRLTSNTLVRDFIAETDEIHLRANGIVQGAGLVSKYLHHNELIAEVTMEVPVETVITRVRELHSEYYHGGHVTSTDITNIKKAIRRDMIRATGSGVPPPRYLRGSAGAGEETPLWVTDRIRATGEATDPRLASAQGRLRAHRAARVVAMRNLLERIYGLPIGANISVRDVLGDAGQSHHYVDGVVTGAVEEAFEITEDSVRVTVSLPGSELWSVIHEQMVIARTHP